MGEFKQLGRLYNSPIILGGFILNLYGAKITKAQKENWVGK